jgi:hypothetical protein
VTLRVSSGWRRVPNGFGRRIDAGRRDSRANIGQTKLPLQWSHFARLKTVKELAVRRFSEVLRGFRRVAGVRCWLDGRVAVAANSATFPALT